MSIKAAFVLKAAVAAEITVCQYIWVITIHLKTTEDRAHKPGWAKPETASELSRAKSPRTRPVLTQLPAKWSTTPSCFTARPSALVASRKARQWPAPIPVTVPNSGWLWYGSSAAAVWGQASWKLVRMLQSLDPIRASAAAAASAANRDS